MAPIKFEEQLKDKLEKRTLSPASESWSKLSERLDADQKKSKNPIFWWLSIAAGLLIMIAVSTQFFNTKNTPENLPQIVEEKDSEEQIKPNELKPKEEKSIELVNIENRVEEEQQKIVPIKNDSKTIDSKKAIQNKIDKTIKLAEQKEQNDLKDDKNLPIQNIENNKQQSIIDDALINEALAVARQDLKNERSGVSDKEIDSLLKVASKALFKENLHKETTKTVDAKLLLESVEDEMGESFRSKVFDALKESYKTVKTAVADRNN